MVITVLKEDQSGGIPDLADLQAWANSLQVTHPVVCGDGINWGLAGGFPTYFVLDQNMYCVYKQGGYSQNQILTRINALLADPPTPYISPTPSPTPGPTEPPTVTPTPGPTEPPTAVPTDTPVPTATPEGVDGVRLHLSDDHLTPGDEFLLTARAGSPTEGLADFFCALEVYGSYFFYPAWGPAPETETIVLPAELTLLGPFDWPSGAGAADGLHFYALVTHVGTYSYFGEIGMVEFGYGP